MSTGKGSGGPTRAQHYVPQFYLRQWCDDEDAFYPVKVAAKEPPSLSVFNKKSGPSRFCYENYFYAQHTGQEDALSQDIEKAFAEIEGVLHATIPTIEQKILDNQQITYEDKYRLCEMMVFFWLKGKAHREQSQRMSETLIKNVTRHMVRYMDRDPKQVAELKARGLTVEDMIDFADRGEYSVDFGNMHHMVLMKEMYGFCNLLAAKYWRIYLSREGHFIATDVPYMDIAKSKHFWGNDFLAREQIFILSPRAVIVALNPKNENGKKISRKDLTGQALRIQAMNMHNLMNSIRFGFHKKRELLEDLSRFTRIVYENSDPM